jgi:hypothetical protein
LDLAERHFCGALEDVLSKKSPSRCRPDGDRLSALRLMLSNIEVASHSNGKRRAKNDEFATQRPNP